MTTNESKGGRMWRWLTGEDLNVVPSPGQQQCVTGPPPAPLGTERPASASPDEKTDDSPAETHTEPGAQLVPVKRTIRADELAMSDLGALAVVEQNGLLMRGLLLHFEPVNPVVIVNGGGDELNVLVEGVRIRVVALGSHDELERTVYPDTPIQLTRLAQ